jgi:N-acetylglucosamine kinase-like BadF-type ATPase
MEVVEGAVVGVDGGGTMTTCTIACSRTGKILGSSSAGASNRQDFPAAIVPVLLWLLQILMQRLSSSTLQAVFI